MRRTDLNTKIGVLVKKTDYDAKVGEKKRKSLIMIIIIILLLHKNLIS